MKDTKYASLIEAIIYKSVRHEVEPESERFLRDEMKKADVTTEFGEGFFHLYRAMNDGIAYCGCAPDPYVGIKHPEFDRAVLEGDALVIVTHGWAAPGEWEDVPSKCPDRRRVRMTVVVETLGKFVSIIRFGDAPDEEPLVEANGQGPLREAIESRILEVVHGMN